MMKMNIRLMIALTIAAVASCKKDKPQVDPPTTVTPQGQKVFVVNEGNFTKSNASISLYDPQAKVVEQDRYASQNSNDKIGDVAQSMIRYKDEYFIVVNNSNQIIVTDRNLKKKAQITGLVSPRFIQPIGNDLAFVSQHNNNEAVVLVNLATRQKVKGLKVRGLGEQMVSNNEYVFLANSSSSYLYFLSIAAQEVSDSVKVGVGGASVVRDMNGKIWVLTMGDWQGSDVPRLCKVNADTKQIEHSKDYSKTDFVSRLVSNTSGDTLYFLHNGIMRWTANDAEPVLFRQGSYYGLGLDPVNGHVYASDPIDYQQPSLVNVFNSKGDSLHSFRAGILAGEFLFD